MRRRWALAVPLALALAGAGGARAETEDRLARFRELGQQYASPSEGGDTIGARSLQELEALVDAEILENLRTGEPFASAAFIQERLDALSEVWGGATFSVLRLSRSGGAELLTLGVFVVAGPEPRGSVRVYGGSGPGASLLVAVTHGGTPEIHSWPPARDGAPQFVASWLGASGGRAGRLLHLELWRGGRGGATRAWSADELFPGGLWATGFGVGRAQISIRYELRYPGWKPGCEGQTEQEDLYRRAPGADTLVLARRQVFNSWHRELQSAVTRFFAALAAENRRGLGELVPDRALRARLPRELHPEPACEERSPGAPPSVIVAATEERDERLLPWSLWWTRGPRGWRLAAASPVLQ